MPERVNEMLADLVKGEPRWMHYLFKAYFLCYYVFSKNLLFMQGPIIPSHVHYTPCAQAS